jgi:hypothetical protein
MRFILVPLKSLPKPAAAAAAVRPAHCCTSFPDLAMFAECPRIPGYLRPILLEGQGLIVDNAAASLARF